jgi:hypothetical protein
LLFHVLRCGWHILHVSVTSKLLAPGQIALIAIPGR